MRPWWRVRPTRCLRRSWRAVLRPPRRLVAVLKAAAPTQVVIAVLLEQFSAAAHKMKEPFSLTETFIRRPNPFRAVHQSLMACQVLVCVCVCVCVCVYTNIYIHMNRCMRAVHQSRMACQILNPKSGTTFQSGPSNPSPCMYVRIVVYLCMCLHLQSLILPVFLICLLGVCTWLLQPVFQRQG